MARSVREAAAPRFPDREKGVETVSEALGSRIRAERQRAGMTVRGLAARTGLSPSLISQIERGRATPSVATLWAIASELQLSIAELFSTTDAADAEPGRLAPTRGRAGDSPVQPFETRTGITLESGVRWERLTAEPDHEMDFIHVVYPPGAASCAPDALVRHSGREYGYVVSGTLAVEIGFDEYVLRPNDSISFDSVEPHRLRAVGDEPVVAVWAVMRRRGDVRAQRLDEA
jgi:transcriptional regulator with XRE-family HTH domain